ncbi:MAG: thioredoxin family protein [Nitrospirota bacterium]
MTHEKLASRIQENRSDFIKPVRLVFFSREKERQAHASILEFAKIFEGQTTKIILESYDMVMDKDKVEDYGIQRSPALVVEGLQEKKIFFYGWIEHFSDEILFETVHALSGPGIWLPPDIRTALDRLTNKVVVRVFVNDTCQECKDAAHQAVAFSLSSRYLEADIIHANYYPDLVKKNQITRLPKTIFGELVSVEGIVSDGEFLERIFQAEGTKPRSDRRCLLCGLDSQDAICLRCKNRIQAEALEQKRKREKKTSGNRETSRHSG